jgi:hypothetical protein
MKVLKLFSGLKSLKKICFRDLSEIDNIDEIFDPSKILELQILENSKT